MVNLHLPKSNASEIKSSERRRSKHAKFQDSPDDASELPGAVKSEKETRRDEQKKWTLGILADEQTAEVPGTVLLLSRYSTRNIPLGLQHEHEPRGRTSSRGSISGEADRRRSLETKKKTQNGQVILEPQPDDSANDPLNWPQWRRDAALYSLGFYCMLGGGITPILAAGLNQVANDLDQTFAAVARTTGLYMLGLGIGSVVMSPTAILFGKRPVYLISSIMFVGTSIWCGFAPNYAHLATARVFQGIAVSPVECLPSATIAEIFFLHERAFRVGIYTLLLLGGKNLIPLVSAVIIQALSWRWVFWIVAMLVAFGGIILFLFVPETFWDRTPRPRALTRRSTSRVHQLSTSASRSLQNSWHAKAPAKSSPSRSRGSSAVPVDVTHNIPQAEQSKPDAPGFDGTREKPKMRLNDLHQATNAPHPDASQPAAQYTKNDPNLPTLHNLNSPYYVELKKSNSYLDFHSAKEQAKPRAEDLTIDTTLNDPEKQKMTRQDAEHHSSPSPTSDTATMPFPDVVNTPRTATSPGVPALVRGDTTLSYTAGLRHGPAKPYLKSLKPWNGRLRNVSWWRAAIRPLILFAYPSVLWSALVYSLSVGWLIVLSESVSHIYANRESYNFNSLQIGLVYMSPFIGGVLGTAVAGRVSDVIVRFMARRNNGIYEPEYRLVMAVPIAISTAIGLMGFGWSAEEHDAWIVPTVFFGIISFGCALGSTTAITFTVDSYRQYAGEALVTLNFSKNVFHGLVWSLFFPQWLTADGPKTVFVAIGGIQLGCMLLTIPMYIFGKRARMWTVRKGMMDEF